MPKRPKQSSRMVRKFKCGQPGCQGHDVTKGVDKQLWDEAGRVSEMVRNLAQANLTTIDLFAPSEVRCAAAVDLGGKLVLTGLKTERDPRERAKLLKELFQSMSLELYKMGISLHATVTEQEQ